MEFHHFSENEWLDRLETEIVTLGLIIYKKRIQHIKNLNSILSILKTNDALYKFELQVLDNLFLDTQNSDEEKTSLFWVDFWKSLWRFSNFFRILITCGLTNFFW